MTPEERYLFDLQGYLVLSRILPAQLVRRMNETIDYLETLDGGQAAKLPAKRRYVQDNPFPQASVAQPGGLDDYVFDVWATGASSRS